MKSPQCPNCKSTNLAVEKQPGGGAHCLSCGWMGKYSLCFAKEKTVEKCDHFIGVTWGWEESSFTGAAYFYSKLKNKRIGYDDVIRDDIDYEFKFCPKCGEGINYSGYVRNRVSEE